MLKFIQYVHCTYILFIYINYSTDTEYTVYGVHIYVQYTVLYIVYSIFIIQKKSNK